jgi:uncharacterized protein YgiM (DUF1202 family)
MKKIIPSNFRQILMSKFRQLADSAALKEAFAKARDLIPAKNRKWLLVALALVLALILVCCLPKDKPAADSVIFTVSTDAVNVHKEYDADSSVLCQLPEGLEIQILETISANGSEWGRVEKQTLSDGTKVKAGWINLKYLTDPNAPVETEPVPVETEPDITYMESTMGTVMTGKLNIRKGAGSKYEAFDAYYEGDRIEILETLEVDDTLWGRTYKGWIGMGYVRMDGTPPAAQEGQESKITSNGKYRILGYGVVDLGELNVRSGPGTDHEKVAVVTEKTRYAYYEIQGDWVRIESGWVNIGYFYIEGITAEDSMNGTVITDDLNIRTGPATSFKSLGTYRIGDPVAILGQVNGWGYTEQGWINMTHVEPVYTTGSGTVMSGLNIRTEPDAESEKAGTYQKGDAVTILEVSGQWGRTDQGWINLKYVKYD